MGFFHFEERMPKAAGVLTLIQGQNVWLYRNKFITPAGEGKVFGCVARDSIWPDMFVTVECWDHDKHGHWMNTEGRRQEGLPPLSKELLKPRKLKRKKRRKRAEF